MWKNIKSWLNWTTSGVPTQLFYNGKLENRPSSLANCMNDFFIHQVRNLKSSLGEPDTNPLENLQKLMAGRKCVFTMKPVHPDTVDKLITNLPNSGAVGLDYIGTGIIKLAKTELSYYQQSLISLICPSNSQSFQCNSRKQRSFPFINLVID